MLLQKGAREAIYPRLTILENNPTSDFFSKPQMVNNICHYSGSYINIRCNTVKRCGTKEVTLKGYKEVWFDEGAITTILSFGRIREKYPVRYDTEVK